MDKLLQGLKNTTQKAKSTLKDWLSVDEGETSPSVVERAGQTVQDIFKKDTAKPVPQDGKEYISPAVRTTPQKIADKIRSTDTGNILMSALFGDGTNDYFKGKIDGKEQGFSLLPKEGEGIVEYLLPETTKDDTTRILERYDNLKEKGIGDERATKVAVEDVMKPKAGSMEDFMATKEGKKTDLTDEEKSVLRKKNLMETLGLGLDVIGNTPFGAITKKGGAKVGTKFLEEAGKYSTPEEFTNALNVAYRDSWKGNKSENADELKQAFEGYYFHGTNAGDKIKTEGFKNNGDYFNSGVYFSTTPDVAIDYMKQARTQGGKTPSVFAVNLDNLKLKEISYDQFRDINKGYGEAEDVVAKLKSQKYDGIKVKDGEEVLVWNPQKIKETDTLEDIWKKGAQGTTKTEKAGKDVVTYKQELDNQEELKRSGMTKLTPAQRAEARKDIEGTFKAVDENKPIAFHWTDSKNADSIVKNGWDHSKTLVEAENPNQWWLSASQYPDSGGAYGDTLVGVFPKKGETYTIGAGDNSVYDRANKTIDIRGTNAGIETQIFSPEKFEYRILNPDSKELKNYSGYQNLTRTTAKVKQPVKKVAEKVVDDTEPLFTVDKKTQDKGIKLLTKLFGDKKSALSHAEDFWAREGEPGVFYHATAESAPFSFDKAKAANYDVGSRAGIANVNGLYVGRDRTALDNFYNIAAERGENMITYKGNPKLLDLTNEEKMMEFTNKYKSGEEIEKAVQEMGYDGIKYFDPYSTGEEIVITNEKALKAVAFNDKPIKTATAKKVATIKGKEETLYHGTSAGDFDMLYTGRKDGDRAYSGTAVTLPKKLWTGSKAEAPKKDIINDYYDEAKEWLYDIQNADAGSITPIRPSQGTIDYLSQFKPNKPVKLYRGVRGDQIMGKTTGYESWTRDKKVAEGFADGGKIIEKIINPEDILVDIKSIPKNVRRDFVSGLDPMAESEVIVRAGLGDIEKGGVKSINPKNLNIGNKTTSKLKDVIVPKQVDKGVVEYPSLYHGTTQTGLTNLSTGASKRTAFGANAVISATDNPLLAKSFTRGELGDKVAGEVRIVEGPVKIIDTTTPEGKELWGNLGKDPKKAIDAGFDGIQHNNYEQMKIEAFYKDINWGDVKDAKEVQLFRDVPTPQVYGKETSKLESVGDILKRTTDGGNGTTKTMGDIFTGEAPSKTRRFTVRTEKLAPEAKPFLQGKYQAKSNKNLIEEADNIIAKSRDEAEIIAKTDSSDRGIAVASRLLDTLTQEAKATKDINAKNAIYEKIADISNETARNLTEAGRSIQAATILGRLTPEGMVRYAARQIQKHNERVAKGTLGDMFGGYGKKLEKIPELTGEEVAWIQREMERIGKIEDEVQRAKEFQAFDRKMSERIPSSLYTKIATLWKAGLLTGLKTSGLNILSNSAHALSEGAKDIPAVLVDKIISLFTGKRTLALTGQGAKEGAREGVAKGWEYLKTGFDERDIGGKLDYDHVNFGKGKVAKLLQKYEEGVFRLIGSQDQPFYYGAKARSLYSQAIAEARNKGLVGDEAKKFVEDLVANPTDDMLKYATLDAETAVFQNQTELGKAGKAIQNIPYVGKFILPFAKTPSAVATQLLAYSPVGIVGTLAKYARRGKFDQRLFSQGIGRGLTGTGVMYLGATLYDSGNLSLSMPTTEKEKKQWELEGRKANSIKIGDKWVSVAVLGPAGLALLVGGAYRKAYDEAGSVAKGMLQASIGGVKSFGEQTFLKGINQFTNALSDPERYGTPFFSSFIGSWIPTIVADVARATDDYERRSPGLLGKLYSRIPGLRETLQPQVDTFGNEIETPSAVRVMADATRSSDIKSGDNVTKELRRLMDAGYPATPTQIGPRDGYKSLTGEQNTQLLKMSGKLEKVRLAKLMESEAYKKADDEMKERAIQREVDRAKVEARARVVYDAVIGLSKQERVQKLIQMKDDKLLTKQVYSAYQSLKNK